MLKCCCDTSYFTELPKIQINMNCDTRLAINLRLFDLGENDEFIFTIKNYDYIESGYVFLYRARRSDIDKNGEIIFKIPPRVSKRLKPGAFYNFAVLANAYDRRQPTEYKKLTDNGKIYIEYGAQDILVPQDPNVLCADEIIAARLAQEDTVIERTKDPLVGEFIDGRLEEV